MNHETAKKRAAKEKGLRLRRKIERKRRNLNCRIKGREDLLKQQKLSRELDCLIVKYLELMG